VQSFHAVVKPLGETRPAWKVLRVLANLLDLPGFDFESAQDVLKKIPGATGAQVPADRLGNAVSGGLQVTAGAAVPAVAAIYQLDSLVRRATSLQLTADARQAARAEGVAA
jgi:NADH-quinone oxidoreductase subunit G